ncbi:MAG: hypothetical protein WC071_09565 [Victivallaceae bacterium]
MRLFSYILLLTMLGFMTWPVSGDTSSRFRLGRILSAEVGLQTVNVADLDKYAFKFPYRNKAYAIVTVKLDPGRSLSTYDFSLVYSGKKYPCIAIRAGQDDFNGDKWLIRKASPEDMYSMLFVVDASAFADDVKTITMTLMYNLSAQGQKRISLPFKFLGNSSFISVTDIPDKGCLVTDEENKGKSNAN